MVSTFLIALMLQSTLAQVDSSRAAFSKCLWTEVNKSLDASVPPAEFTEALPKKCEASRAAFRNALIAADRANGDSAATAAQNADEQVEDYHLNFADKYKDYSETNTRPAN